MANLSNETRKDQVLRFLAQHSDWIDGPELANERVGGSEGLKRVRELRAEGHRIITRPHPDRTRDIFQYKLVRPESLAPVVQHRLDEMLAEARAEGYNDIAVAGIATQVPSGPAQEHPAPATSPEPPPPMMTPGQAGRDFLIRRNEQGEFELTKEVCVECGGVYDDDLEHRTTDARHLRWMEGEQKRSAGQLTIGVPEQPPPYRFTKMPEKIDMGTMAWCTRCEGKRRKKIERYSRKRGEIVVTEAEDFTRDPYHPTTKGEPNLCPRCGGLGVIPVHIEDNNTMQPVRE